MSHLMLPPAQPVDRRAYKAVLIQLGKAHEVAYLLDAVRGVAAYALTLAPEVTRAWLRRSVHVSTTLNEILARIEREYRRLAHSGRFQFLSLDSKLV